MEHYDKRVSSIKAVCIILMVVGHSGCPDYLNRALFLFCMPCFFFVSGFLLKDKYLDNMPQFFKRKIKGYWVPFVKWSLVFLLSHNIFYDLHLYGTEYGKDEFLNKLSHILTMTGSEQLLGGYWFLKELLYAAVISLLGLKLIRTVFHTRKILGGFGLMITFLILSYILGIVPFKIPTIGHRTMLACAYFMAGSLYHRTEFRDYHDHLLGILLFLVLGVISMFFSSSIDVTEINVFTYFFVSLIGIFALLNIAGCIKGRVERGLDYIGQKTLYILTFHFLSFKLVSFLLIWVLGLPIGRLADFPIISNANGPIDFIWIIYSTVGIAIPILLWELNHCLNAKYKLVE